MRFQGRLHKEGRFWLAEVPVFDAMTQGGTRRAALDMIADWFVSMAGRKGFSVKIHAIGKSRFEVNSSDTRVMVSLLLQRQRQKSGLSLAQAAQRLGAKSRNAYARYERGASVPTVEKLEELLRAVTPGRDLVLQQSAAAQVAQRTSLRNRICCVSGRACRSPESGTPPASASAQSPEAATRMRWPVRAAS